MTIEEVKAMKEVLETHIQSELDKFTELTGLTVTEVNISKYELLDANARVTPGPYEIRLTAQI